MLCDLTTREFLSRYWQRKPLVFQGAFEAVRGVVDGNELAGLACEEVVESRLVRGAGIAGPWRCEHGPFVDDDYAALGTANWTLLVQGVDQWIHEVRALMRRFDFLPAWRLEDVMASFAPTGGGVGPHYDYYDVFLIQVSGRRRWDLGGFCDDDTPLQKHQELRLLGDFTLESSHELGPGDGIYIPAGIAHWGTSLSDDCVTLSVGFRAPSDAEILHEAIDLLAPTLPDARRFRDTIESIDADRFRINAAACRYAQTVLDRLDHATLQSTLAEAFGRLVTDTRYSSDCDEIPEMTVATLALLLERQGALGISHRAHSRLAYSDCHLFANGSAYAVDVRFARNLCHGVIETPVTARELEVLVTLFNEGAIVLE